jgi:hypothetical protein
MKRYLHDLSHYHLLSFNMGEIIPISCVEILPGDSVQQDSAALVRVTPQLKPVMHPVEAEITHYFVPNRILWSGWEDFITGVSATPPPTITGGAHTEGDLSDYLGVYDDASNDFSALPVRAYNKIFNDYWRDQDLVSEVSEDTNTIQKAAWKKDYFTAARTVSQAGSSVTLPIGTEAPVLGIGKANQTYASSSGTMYESGASGTTSYSSYADSADFAIEEDPDNSGYPHIYADLTSATGVDIRDFREALAVQRYNEARARYGDNYVDYLRYLGIRPSDARLQRPEYLAGGRQSVAFSEVIQSAYNSNASTQPGDLYGHGLAAMRTNRFRRFFEEHGWLISLMVVRPRAIYVNGLPRKFSKTTKEDYFQKELQDVGAQEVYNKEVYAPHTTPDGIFGYSPRYAEYMFEESRVSGEFRNSTNYDWHFGRIFGSDPALNQSFIECNPTKRVFAEQSNDSLWVMARNNIRARRQVRMSNVGRVL